MEAYRPNNASSLRALSGLNQPPADLPDDLDHERHILGRGPEVHEAHAQAGVAVDGGRRKEHAPVALHLAGEFDVVRVDVACAGWNVLKADGGEHGVVEELELGRFAKRVGEEAGVGESGFYPGAVPGGAIDAEGHPEPQGPERARVLESTVYRVGYVALVQHVRSSWPNAVRRRPISRSNTTLQLFCTPSHLWASIVAESARSKPANSGAADGATTATATTPAATSPDSASSSASGCMRCFSSTGIDRTALLPSPQTSTARTTEWCDSAEQYTAALRAPSPSTRHPGSARSRAARSAVRVEVMPPLVNAPSANGKPTKPAIQRRVCSSTRSAPPAATARFAS